MPNPEVGHKRSGRGAVVAAHAVTEVTGANPCQVHQPAHPSLKVFLQTHGAARRREPGRAQGLGRRRRFSQDLEHFEHETQKVKPSRVAGENLQRVPER